MAETGPGRPGVVGNALRDAQHVTGSVTVPFRPFAGPEHHAFELGDGGRQALLVHGFPGTPAEMRPLAEVVAARGWRVRVPLLPCFGPDIVNLGHCRWQDWVSLIETEWTTLCAVRGTCALIGYSMGAAIALHVAAARPPDRLVLVAPFWRVPGLLARAVPVLKWVLPRWRPFAKADFGDPALRAQLGRLLPGVDLDDPAVHDFVRREMVLPLAAVHEVLRLGTRAARLAPRVTAPTLVVQGASDPVVAPALTRQLVSRLGAGRVRYVETAGGHDLIQAGVDGAAGVAAMIADYLETST